MAKINKFLAALAAIVVAGAVFIGVAFAGTPAQITNESISYSALTLQDEQVVAINATINGKLEIMAQQPKLEKKFKKGLTRKQLKKLMKGHSRKIQRVGGLTCRWGMAIWGASRTSSGQTVWTPRPGNHGLTHGCLIDGIWRQVLGGPDQWNCGNQIVWMNEELPQGAPTFTGRTQIVSHFTFDANATATAHVSATLSATASCTSGGASASTGGYVTGEGHASVTFTASGRTQAEANTKASSGVHSAVVQQSSSLQGSAKASAELNLGIAAWAQCSSSPQPQTQSVKVTAFTTLNRVSAGKNSGPAPFSVYASTAGGSVTVNPGRGGVSMCDSTTPQSSVRFNLAAGNNDLCVIVYASNDADKPATDTVTYSAFLGSASNAVTDTFQIVYSIHP